MIKVTGFRWMQWMQQKEIDFKMNSLPLRTIKITSVTSGFHPNSVCDLNVETRLSVKDQYHVTRPGRRLLSPSVLPVVDPSSNTACKKTKTMPKTFNSNHC